MFNKSLVSIYFTKTFIFVLQLNQDKRKVNKYHAIELPEGLIKGNRVQDRGVLGKILREAWSKGGFKEESVGLILPEFSTFTKILQLPKLAISELDEAIRWQAQEYLPSNPEDMIMDWKIVDRNDKGFEILIVAVAKDILKDYVDATEAAELFPIVVETPSLCLNRLVNNETGGKLLIYADKEEALLVIFEREKILGTSVIHSSEASEIMNTASKMITHFEKIKPNKIFVGGPLVSEDLIQGLINNLKQEISLLKPEISGMPYDKVQEFLIPISAQQGEYEEPSDPRTLNLLPSGLVEEYSRAKLKVQVWSLTLTTTLFVWISFLVVLGAYLLLGQQIGDMESKNSAKLEVSRERGNIQAEVKKINEATQKFAKIKDITVVPQTVLNIINKAKPPGVSVEGYDVNLDRGVVTITGVSNDRVSLISFKQNLETSPEIGSAEIPISNFEGGANLDFQIDLQYLPITSKLSEKEKTK